MNPTPLRDQLESLHQKLQQAQPMDAAERDLLQTVQRDIQSLLTPAGGMPATADSSMLARLDHALKHFEVSHPHLTLALAQLIDTLSGAGV